MPGGCGECGRKGGCDHRKAGMLAAVDAALARLYPTRRWDERSEADGFRAGAAPGLGPALADALALRLRTSAVYRPGTAEEYCDFVYVLCLGREPSLLAVREGLAGAAGVWDEVAPPPRAHGPAGRGAAEGAPEGPEAGGLDEIHLRLCLSALAPVVAVQEVSLRAERLDAEALLVTEAVRAGVFDPALLPRFRGLVAVLAEHDVLHLDFGDISAPPPGYDGGPYRGLYGQEPAVANYLFFPQPCASVSTTAVPLAFRRRDRTEGVDAPASSSIL